MHARWINSLVLSFSLAFASGCMIPSINGSAEMDRRTGFKDSEAETGARGASSEKPNSAAASSVSTERATDAAGNSRAETNGKAVSENAAPVQPLGSAHSAKRLSSNAETEARQSTLLPADSLASQQTGDEQEQALQEVVAELEALGELDSETKRQLIADLRETKPALWQPMLSIYRLALANRKRTDARPLSAPLSAQALASDEEASFETGRAETKPAATSKAADLAARLAQPARMEAASETPESYPAASKLAHRPSPLRPDRASREISTSYPPEMSDIEVQPMPYEETTADLATDSTLPRRSRDRAVRLASASTNLEPVNRQTASQPLTSVKHRRSAVPIRAVEIADWQAYLEESILLLEEDTPGPARTAEEVRRQAELRLLYLAGGDREAALRPIDGISTTQQEFWSEGLFALATYLDAEALPDGPRRAAEARRHLEAAITRLGELSTLGVRNIAFCSKVNSYGIYETYEQDEFEPGQQVLLYAELENFKCDETPTGFVTSVRSSYQIFDSRGVRVESHDFAVTEETCRNRRRDFFMRYFVDLPTRIYDGEYTLKITIEDMKGQTSGESTIPFRIKEHKQKASSGYSSGSRSGPGGL